MGDIIDATGQFRMAKLEADVARADRTQIWDLRELNEAMKSDIDNIILPPTLEED